MMSLFQSSRTKMLAEGRRLICYWTHVRGRPVRQIPVRDGRRIVWKDEKDQEYKTTITLERDTIPSRPIVNTLAAYGALRILSASSQGVPNGVQSKCDLSPNSTDPYTLSDMDDDGYDS